MSGLGIRLYTDEDVDANLAIQLRHHGYDVVSCSEAGKASQALDDEWQLTYATSLGRVIFVHNNKHFIPLAHRWAAIAKEHAGIICAPQIDPGALIQRTIRHLNLHTPQDHHNVVLYLAP